MAEAHAPSSRLLRPSHASSDHGRRLLMVAYYFPPIGGIGSIRAARLATHLPELGWDVTVVAPADTPHSPDPLLEFPEKRVVRSRSIEISRLSRRRSPNRVGRVANHARKPEGQARPSVRSVGRDLVYPDAQIGWYPGAVASGLRLSAEQPFDAILSSSFPITAHLVARTISRRRDLPWVAEFRDPWSHRLPRAPHRRRAARLEQQIAQRADRIVMTSQTWGEHFGSSWDVDVAVIPNGFDEGTEAAPASPSRGTLAHVGVYYPGRQSLDTVWRALAELGETTGARPAVRWVGDLPSAAREEIAAHGLLEQTHVTGFVPHEDAKRHLASSTMLFASGPVESGPDGRGWLPAKLFEYLASGLPILFVGHPDGDAASLLRSQPGCFVVEFGDVAGARRAIEAGLSGGRCERALDGFTRRARACQMADLLDEVVGA